MKKNRMILLILFIVLAVVFVFFFVGSAPKTEEVIWGVNFSQKHSRDMGLDWRENYSALIDDLGVKRIKLAAHWDLIEPEQEEFSFQDLDWQIEKAEESGVGLLMAIGMKTPRWPECHIPGWAKDKSKDEQQQAILRMLEEIVLRYKDSPVIEYWQVENEPFFPFGDCPWVDKGFVKKEVELVKSLDKNHEVIISDSGEGSLWIQAAQLGDIVGTTMYRKVWIRQASFYFSHPFPSVFYWRRAQVIKKIFNKEVICVELQAEPWGPTLLYHSPLEEQAKTMSLEQFKKNIDFAKATGLDEFYLWGSEWWYWMKEKQGDSAIWEEARKLW